PLFGHKNQSSIRISSNFLWASLGRKSGTPLAVRTMYATSPITGPPSKGSMRGSGIQRVSAIRSMRQGTEVLPNSISVSYTSSKTGPPRHGNVRSFLPTDVQHRVGERGEIRQLPAHELGKFLAPVGARHWVLRRLSGARHRQQYEQERQQFGAHGFAPDCGWKLPSKLSQ